MNIERVKEAKKDKDLKEITQKAHRKVMKWPRWKRAIKVTKYSTGFITEGGTEMNTEKVKVMTAIYICDKYGSDNWTDLPEGERGDFLELANQVLSINLGNITIGKLIELYLNKKLFINSMPTRVMGYTLADRETTENTLDEHLEPLKP